MFSNSFSACRGTRGYHASYKHTCRHHTPKQRYTNNQAGPTSNGR